MRVLALLAVIAIVLMFLGGWLYFQDGRNTSEIILDKQKVQQDTEKAVESGEEALEQAAEGLKKLGEKADDAVSDEEAAAGPDEGAPKETSEREPAKQPADQQ